MELSELRQICSNLYEYSVGKKVWQKFMTSFENKKFYFKNNYILSFLLKNYLATELFYV